jgi:hypothetical protein
MFTLWLFRVMVPRSTAFCCPVFESSATLCHLSVRVPFVPIFSVSGACALSIYCVFQLYCVQVSLWGAPVPLVWVLLAQFGSTKSSFDFGGPRSTPLSLWEIVLLTLTRILIARTHLHAWGLALIRRKSALDLFKLAACKRFSVPRHFVLLPDASEFRGAVPFARCFCLGAVCPIFFF